MDERPVTDDWLDPLLARRLTPPSLPPTLAARVLARARQDDLQAIRQEHAAREAAFGDGTPDPTRGPGHDEQLHIPSIAARRAADVGYPLGHGDAARRGPPADRRRAPPHAAPQRAPDAVRHALAARGRARGEIGRAHV